MTPRDLKLDPPDVTSGGVFVALTILPYKTKL